MSYGSQLRVVILHLSRPVLVLKDALVFVYGPGHLALQDVIGIDVTLTVDERVKSEVVLVVWPHLVSNFF